MTYNPSGKFKIIRGGVLLPPGSCMSCGSANSDEFVDFDLSLEWYGAVYLCKSCIREAGSVFDLISAADESILRGQIESQVSLIDELKQVVVDKERLNESYRRVIADFQSSAVAVINGSPVSDEQVDSEPIGTVEDSPFVVVAVSDVSVDDTGTDVSSDAPSSDEHDTDDTELAIERASAALIGAAGVVGEPSFSERTSGSHDNGRLFGES